MRSSLPNTRPARSHSRPTAAAKPRALLSVYDKTGLIDLGKVLIPVAKSTSLIHRPAAANSPAARVGSLKHLRPISQRLRPCTRDLPILIHIHTRPPNPTQGLVALGFDLLSTGGSASSLAGASVPVKQVEEVTKFPEMLDGRVKTLHPGVHGGILAKRSEASHMDAIGEHGIGLIDIVVVNLYPFRETVASGASPADCIEKIDIGGPAMIRAAAKNHGDVFVVTDPSDYAPLLEFLKSGAKGEAAQAFRKQLAWKAFQHCASYDSAVAEWFWFSGGAGGADGSFPPMLTVPLEQVGTSLRYGENPHQKAAFYKEVSLAESKGTGLAGSTLHWGKEMSYNNYLDTDAAYGCVSDFTEPTCVIVKHTNPCGVASAVQGADILEAYRLAVRADPISAFGGIVAFNRPLDEKLAKEIREFRSPTDNETRMFYEIVIAPGYTPEGLETLKGKSKQLRILEAAPRAPGGRVLRQVGGGFLYQGADDLTPEQITFTVVSEAQPSATQLEDLRFAWRVVKHVKSNAITVAKGGKLLGMGSGQPNRVKSTEIALEKAGAEAQGSVLASDAFFPFSWGDSVEKACQAGVKAIAHPGGSIRDQVSTRGPTFCHHAVPFLTDTHAGVGGASSTRASWLLTWRNLNPFGECSTPPVQKQDAVDCCNKYGVVLVTTGHRHFRH